MPDVLIPTPRGQMPAYLAVPSNPGSVPGVVVLHDIGGMSADHRNQANWLAEAGFLALSIDLYYKGGLLLCLRQVIRDLIARKGPAFDDVEASRAWLLAQPSSNGKVGVIGFCMGGGFALLLVSGHGFSAASINYGGKLPPDVDDFLKTACPVVGSYGGRAKWEQGVADELQRNLGSASQRWQRSRNRARVLDCMQIHSLSDAGQVVSHKFFLREFSFFRFDFEGTKLVIS